MRKVIFGICCLTFVLANAMQSAEARPKYFAELRKAYKDIDFGDVKCNACHEGNNKKDKNDYGIAFGTVLNAKNAKDSDQILKALKDTESKPSKVEGKTYGDLLKAKSLPGTSAK